MSSQVVQLVVLLLIVIGLYWLVRRLEAYLKRLRAKGRRDDDGT